MMHDPMMKDKITLKKKNGEEYKDIPSLVDTKKVFTNSVEIPFEEGDYLCRTLPNGLEESYLIIQAHYYDGIGGIPSNYQIEVRKTTREEFSNFKTVNNYNISSNSGKININSTDNSTTYNNLDDLFKELHSVANSIEDSDVNIHELINDMKENVGKQGYIDKYKSFIQNMANHMVLFTPFIPALTNLLV